MITRALTLTCTAFVIASAITTTNAANSSLLGSPNCGAALRSATSITNRADLDIAGTTAFVLTSNAGLQSYDVSDTSSPLLLDTVAIGSSQRKLIVEDGIAYCMSLTGDLFTIDVSDPADMAVLGQLTIPAAGSILPLANDFTLSGDLLYVTMTSNDIAPGVGVVSYTEMQVIDISTPSLPAVSSTFLAPSDQVNGFSQIVIDGSHALISGPYDTNNTGSFTGGVGIWDISDTMNITLEGFLPTTVNMMAKRGDYLYINGSDFKVADVSDPANPVLISSLSRAGSDMGVSAQGNFALCGDSYYNVANPANPYLIYNLPAFTSSIIDSRLDGNLIYTLTNFGMEIADLEDCGLVCAADLTGDGNVNFFDISLFLTLYAAQDPSIDYDNSGTVDFFDVDAFLDLYAIGCP